MKIKYLIIIILVTSMAAPLLKYPLEINTTLFNMICTTLGILSLVCLCILIYRLFRNLFRAIKGLVTKKVIVEPEADILRSEIERLSKRVEELEKDH